MNRRNFLKSFSALPVIAAAPFLLKEKKMLEIGTFHGVRIIEDEDPWRKALEPGVMAWKGEMKSAVLNDYWVTVL